MDAGGFGVDVQGRAGDDGAEVEGAGHRGGDDRQAQRGAFVGAGEVGVALDVEGGDAGAGADRGRSHFRCRRDSSGCAAPGASVGDFPALRQGDLGLGAVGDAGELAEQALGQGGVDAGECWVPSSRESFRTKGL